MCNIMKFLAGILLFVVAVVNAYPGYPRPEPDCRRDFHSNKLKFTVKFWGVWKSFRENGSYGMSHGMLSYDGEQKRLYTSESFEDGSSFQTIKLFNKKVKYFIEDGVCNRSPMVNFKDPFRQLDNAEVGRERVGSSRWRGVDLVRYFGGDSKVAFVATFTADKCMLTSYLNSFQRNKFVGYTRFFDVEKLKESDFQPPSNCIDEARDKGSGSFDDDTDTLPPFSDTINRHLAGMKV